MKSIGTKEGSSIRTTGSFFSEKIEQILKHHFDLSDDYEGVTLDVFQKIKLEVQEYFNFLLEKEDVDLTESKEGSLRYTSVMLESIDTKICIDRFNKQQKEILDIDAFLVIINKALENPDSFFYFDIKESTYKELYELCKLILKEKKMFINDLEKRDLEQLKKEKLIKVQENQIFPTAKLKQLYS